jgi:endonuclease YncB( thermonuclease family)
VGPAAAVATLLACHTDPVTTPAGEPCVLQRWEDGDTPYVDCGSGPAPVRLLEIDTAESGFDENSSSRAAWQAKLWQLSIEEVVACGKRATVRAREICPDGSAVTLRGDARDKYDQRLVDEGHAGRYPYPADPERPRLCGQ